MAKYTVELRDIVKSGFNIFNFDYTLYDETKKSEFEQRFIDHFYFREIGCETVGRFQHYLKCKCNEVLPYYNEMFKTALYEYDLKNNYNLTETFTKTVSNTKTATDKITQDGSTKATETTSSEKTSEIDSTNTRTETSKTEHGDKLIESGTANKTSIIDIDGKTVESDTPTGLLSMSDIKNNVYASKANIEDTTNKTTDNQSNTATKTNESTDETTNSIEDKVESETTDYLSGTTHNTGLINNTTNGTRNENDNGTESYTLERVGDIGVDTTPDKLRKHIELQKTLTTIYAQFFEECNDLFMLIF